MKTWITRSVRVLVLVLGVGVLLGIRMRPSVARSSDVFVGTVTAGERGGWQRK
jgi:hypothetical protein